MRQRSLFDDEPTLSTTGRSGSFVDNMQLPIHRWFRYSAGFSAEWVSETIRAYRGSPPFHVFDPFAGSGTVVLEAERAEVEGLGYESHPFVARIAQAKLHWREDVTSFRALGKAILKTAQKKDVVPGNFPSLITRCYPPEILTRLVALKEAVQEHAEPSGRKELCWLALVSILRQCSPVGTAQWQYVLPRKSKARVEEPLQAFEDRIELMASDMRYRQRESPGPCGRVVTGDARTCEGVPDGWADLVISSPPYANNYDYADATRLEMTFLGEIHGWGDLQSAIRPHLIRSCTQHVASIAHQTAAVLESKEVQPIAAELRQVCAELERVK